MNLCSVKTIETKYLQELANKAINQALSSDEFTAIALELFTIHRQHNEVYKDWVSFLKINPESVRSLNEIPFLPVRFFKSHQVLINTSQAKNPDIIFTSSTTTGGIPSQHFVPDIEVYENSFMKGFQHFYGDPDDWTILALLPGYLERSGSSLVYMAEKLIEQSKQAKSGFYLNDFDKLAETLASFSGTDKKGLLIGVSFGLLDFIESNAFLSMQNHTIKNLCIMETGGMKGRRKELTRMELHENLTTAFGVKKIHSEYGMTELLSQAYSSGDGLFACPPWMKVMLRETDNPLKTIGDNSTDSNTQNGGINIIDLANTFSCPFIAVDDIGKMHANGQFEVLGRFDQSEVRGCNLMIE